MNLNKRIKQKKESKIPCSSFHKNFIIKNITLKNFNIYSTITINI